MILNLLPGLALLKLLAGKSGLLLAFLRLFLLDLSLMLALFLLQLFQSLNTALQTAVCLQSIQLSGEFALPLGKVFDIGLRLLKTALCP
ncbi:hypothetical protein [Allofournierella massiliensis]|uniref:Uncharacterized protein n=1 Tax=Allofournierella massiliensis TaxID=1650663 RepID=A0ABT7UQS5_9FIRM|nr:hypothetical protein [Fournierella massiliensis]MDM8201240.1 hypothetical protein [Fournierella massiliensis]